MAKKKTAPVKVEEKEIEKVEVEEVKAEENTVVPAEITKEKVCEFYGISDAEVFDWDFAKYWVSKAEAEVLEAWGKENAKVKAWDIEFNMYKGSEEVKAIIVKYGITAEQVANWEMDELSAEEKDIITNYYNELVKWL